MRDTSGIQGFSPNAAQNVEECDQRLDRSDGTFCHGLIMPGTLRKPLFHDDLIRAIDHTRLIEFAYKAGRRRIAEPHDYGMKDDVARLLAYQISGESRSGTPHGWKHFDVDDLRELRVLERRFAGSRADARQHHRSWDVLFARVK
jgi:hypothetical protein